MNTIDVVLVLTGNFLLPRNFSRDSIAKKLVINIECITDSC